MKGIMYFFIILIFFSCEKEDSIHYVKGTVVEEGSGIPVAGAKVLIFKNPYDGDPFQRVDSAITDISGKYEIRYSRVAFTDYYIRYSADKCFNLNAAPKKLQKGKIAINFPLVPYGYLKIHYVKNNLLSQIINVQLTMNNYVDDFCSCVPNFDLPFDITREPVPVPGNCSSRIEWGVTGMKPGSSVSTVVSYSNAQTVYIKKGDTLLYTITLN